VPYLVLTGKGERTREKGGLPPGTLTYPDLAGVVDALLAQPPKEAEELPAQKEGRRRNA
jgi:D-glycero-D-manno-heptose 1,7-bisphosphate phosphatase